VEDYQCQVDGADLVGYQDEKMKKKGEKARVKGGEGDVGSHLRKRARGIKEPIISLRPSKGGRGSRQLSF